jgi:AraC-like DNA-binding protein
MPAMEMFSTSGLPPHRRLEYWNDLCSDTLSPVVAEATDVARFEPSLARTAVGDLRMGEMWAAPSVVHHSRQHVARTREAMFFLQIQLEGYSLNRQDGREAWLGPGDFTVFDNTRPYERVPADANRVLVIAIPDEHMRRQIVHPESIVAIKMSHENNLMRMVAEFAQGYWRQCCRDAEQVAPTLNNVLLNLVGCAYSALPQVRACDSAHLETMRLRIVHFIEDHLSDMDLSPTKIAATFKTSPRYVHGLFAGGPETVSRYILRRRLEECARLLTSPAHRSRTISDIAFDYGFTSCTHFGKVFREHYDLTPTEYRRRQYSLKA